MHKVAFWTLLFVASALHLWHTPSARAQFIGELKLSPPGCEVSGKCNIASPFKYRDPSGVEWLTAPPDVTDGATIPFWAQPFVGQPFASDFIKAAVIHDHYCVRQVRPWRDTHRVFYHALIESGVAPSTAMLMYYAVYLGGPKWVRLMPPKTCPGTTGRSCVFQVDVRTSAGSTLSSQSLVGSRLARPSTYDASDFVSELQEVEKLLEHRGNAISLADLEKRAHEKRPNDFFYSQGDALEILLGDKK